MAASPHDPGDAVLDPTRVAVVLPLAVGTFLVLFSLVGIRLPGLDGLRDPESPWLGFVDVRNEGNPHTWLNVVVLALAASLSAVLAGIDRGARRAWAALAIVLALLSLDDLTSLHERLEPLGRDMTGERMAVAWVVPGAIVGAVLAAIVALAARRLPRPVLGPLTAGLAVFGVAAVGLEVVGGSLLDDGADRAYVVVSHVEEWLETVAAVLLLQAPLRAFRIVATADGMRFVRATPPSFGVG